MTRDEEVCSSLPGAACGTTDVVAAESIVITITIATVADSSPFLF